MSEPTPSTSDARQSGDATAEAPMAKLDKKKSIILGAIGLFFIVLIFWKVIPQIGGGYEAAWKEIQQMSPLALVLILIAVVVYLAAYGFPFKAATPGLGYWPSQQVNQAAFTISNGVPAGGAVGLAFQYGMLTSYGITGTASTAAITAVGIWSTFVSLGFPILGVVALGLAGGASNYAWVGPVGLAILVVSVLVFVLIMRSERIAVGVGNLANHLIRPLRGHVKALQDIDVITPITKFRVDMYGLLKRRWLAITVAQVMVSFTQFLILYVTLRGLEGWSSTTSTSALAVFGAFATAQIMLMVPITPGGVGTVDALMITLLQSMGVPPEIATAADVLWRFVSYVPQIIIGLVALIVWFRKAGRKYAAAKG